MTSVAALADLIAREFYGGDVSDDAGLERTDFQNYVYAALGWLLKKKYFDGRSGQDEADIDPTCLSTYEVPVLKSENDGFYSVLPEAPLDLPNGRGIYAVRPLAGDARPFHPMSDGELFLYASLPQTFTTYSQRGSRVMYRNLNPTVINHGVKVVLVSARPEYVPDAFVRDIQDIVLGRLTKTRFPEDKLNDGVPNLNNTRN